MKKLISFIKKEFYHILRDPLTLLIMFALPVILMSILSFAVSTEIKNIPFVVLDQSRSADSKELIEKISANAFFELKGNMETDKEVESAFRRNSCSIALVIPSDFGNAALHSGVSEIQVMVDASDPNQASTMANYLQAEINDFQQHKNTTTDLKATIKTEVKMLYNPQMLSTYNIVPGLKGMVLLLICTLMTSIAVVREKELGTMEILLVSPLKPQIIIFAKAIPYLAISIIDVMLILLLSNKVLEVPINGSVGLLMLLALEYIFTALSLGMLISTITQTQQTAVMTAGLGLILPSLLQSGLIFTVENMHKILQWVSCLIPARWFIEALRDVMIKGLGFAVIWKQFFILLGMCIVLMTVSIRNFKSRL